MKVFAISDLHLSTAADKPMDIFGANWDNHFEKIKEDWQARVSDEDVVLLSGDHSWADGLADALPDLNLIGALNGKKIIIKGNHDIWWSSISRLREALPKGMYALQNDSIKFGKFVFCGSRGWDYDCDNDADKKIYERELLRLEMSLQAMEKLREEGDKVIAMCHYPPYNSYMEPSRVTAKFTEHKVDKVVYGHLHGGNNRRICGYRMDGVEYFLTSCDQTGNKLIQLY